MKVFLKTQLTPKNDGFVLREDAFVHIQGDVTIHGNLTVVGNVTINGTLIYNGAEFK